LWKTFWTSSSCSRVSISLRTVLERLLQVAEVGEGAADEQLGLPLLAGRLAHLLEPEVDEVELELLGLESGRVEPERPHPLEEEGDGAGVGEVAAPLVEVGAQRRDRARRVVGRGLDHHRDAVRRVALVEDLLVVGRVLARSLLDRRFDLVLRHVDRAGVLDRAAQRRVGLGVGTPGLDGDGDLLADARELLGHLVPAGEHRVLAGFEDASHGRSGAFEKGGSGLRAPGRAGVAETRRGFARSTSGI